MPMSGRQRESAAHVPFPAAEMRRVHSEHKRAAAGRLRTRHQVACDLAVSVDVELKPQRPGRCGGNVFDRRGAIVLQHIIVPALPAARAAASSPSGWPSRLNAVGASATG
jgi:hypothetical protein